MRQVFLKIAENKKITAATYRMILKGDIDGDSLAAGSFVNIKLSNCFLRRPISVCDAGPGFLTIVYRVVGKGTERMTELEPAETVDVLIGLGNGFDLNQAGSSPLIVGGGIGSAPLYLLTKRLVEKYNTLSPHVVLGFKRGDEVFNAKAFLDLGCQLTIMTEDGKGGKKGFVTDGMPDSYSYLYTCGPLPMLKAVYKVSKTDGEFSFEERMGCGFGACMGCSVQTRSGPKRVCKDGPVLKKEEILW